VQRRDGGAASNRGKSGRGKTCCDGGTGSSVVQWGISGAEAKRRPAKMKGTLWTLVTERENHRGKEGERQETVPGARGRSLAAE